MMVKPDAGLPGYYKHASVVIKLFRFAVLLGFVVFAVFSIGFFRENITVDNLRYLLKYIDLSGTDQTPSEAEIAVTTDAHSSFLVLGTDLAVVGNTGTALYDFAGNRLYSYDYTYANAAVATNGKNFLVYDTAGKNMALYGGVSKILEKEFEYPVKSACINRSGDFAVINSEKTYRSGVIAFDRDGNELFRFMSADKYMTGVALNDNASSVAFSAVYAADGAFCTELVTYNTATGEKTAQTVLPDTLALKIGYADNDSVLYLLTDSSFECYRTSSLEKIGEAAYNPDNAKFFRAFPDCFMLAESNNLSGSSMTVRAYAYDGSLLFECRTQDKILDLEYADRVLYLLGRDALTVYDYGTASENMLTPLAELPLTRQYRAVRADSYGRFILVGAKNASRHSLSHLLDAA